MQPRHLVATSLLAVCSLLGCDDQPSTLSLEQAVATPSARVRLRLSGHLEGRLEPCGCASAQLGGLARRAFLLKQDRSYDLLIEGGTIVPDGGPLSTLKLLTTLGVLEHRGARYDALGLSATDLELPPEELEYLVDASVPVITSDLEATGELAWPGKAFVERAVGDATVRIGSLALAVPDGSPLGAGLRLLPPEAAWSRALAGAADDTLRVLLVHGTREQVEAQAGLRPRPDLIVAVSGAHLEPPREPSVVEGVPIVHPGTRGRFLLDVTITRAGTSSQIVHYQPIRLEGSRTAKGAMEDRDIKQLILDHRQIVKELGVREQEAERETLPDGAAYVGNTRCLGCHPSADQAWRATKHARAWQTLVEAEAGDRYGWPVTHYPDCVGCHSVGYGKVSGFVNPERTPDLGAVGCEACHGPGKAHSDNPLEVGMGEAGATSCRACHDLEQSPDFDYAARWRAIEHGLEEHQRR